MLVASGPVHRLPVSMRNWRMLRLEYQYRGSQVVQGTLIVTRSTSKRRLNWSLSQIYELGLISGTVYDGQWANGLLEAALNWNTTIPSNLLPGDYLIRWETLAIHQADTPQFYPECAQLHITGTGTAFPPSSYLVSIPGAWTATDPGVNIDVRTPHHFM